MKFADFMENIGILSCNLQIFKTYRYFDMHIADFQSAKCLTASFFLVFLGFWFWFEVAMSHCRALPFAVKVCIRVGPISFSPFAVKVCIRLVLKMTPPALVCRFWFLGDPKWSIG